MKKIASPNKKPGTVSKTASGKSVKKTRKVAPRSLTSKKGFLISGMSALQSGELTSEHLLSTVSTRHLSGSRSLPDLPIGEKAARRVTRWLTTHFGTKMERAGVGTPFSPAILCAIVCQETAYFWLPLLEKLEKKPEHKNDPNGLADLILARCVLDASGDHPDSSRSAFPKNTAAFQVRFGAEFTNLLIAEANKTRALRDYAPRQWVYKGYGIFQYDLQFVTEDEEFFRERKWYDFDVCLEKCVGELTKKYQSVGGNLWEAIRAYNGAGPRAQAYRDNVKIFAEWTRDEIEKLPVPTRALTRGGEMPSSRPRLSQVELAAKLAPYTLDRTKHPLIVVGIRGYYLDSLGQPGVNDRGMYDDAIFIDSPDVFAAFNGNTDPSKVRAGYGFEKGTKGMAKLKAGAWFAHKLDFHGSEVYGPYRAICQRLGKVTVIRDGKDGKDYEDTDDDLGINIHKGSYNGTSSLGCQTIHPDQWSSFINLAMDLAKRYYGERWEKAVIPYVLMEQAA